ncbi:hypothetical protein KKA72_01395 [Patescibacteria group bacterium]|nr:hypothetical protein [Patescibacteria group bacterium]
MLIKKIFTKSALFFYRTLKALLIIILVLIIVTPFLSGDKNIFDRLQENDAYIVYISVGVVLYAILLSHIDHKIYILRNSLNSIANPSACTSEADIVSMLGNQATGFDSQDFFPITFPTEEINVRVYRDPEELLANYKTFDFDYISKTNPLLEKELFHQLERTLQAHGLTRTTKDPQVIISMDFFIGKKEQYTPPKTVISTETKYVWNTGMIGWNVGGFTSAVPVMSSTTTPGYTTTSYYSNIRLNFLNHAKLVKEEKLEIPPLIWLGEAESEGLNPDIRGIAAAMFGELIGNFLNQSVDSSKCYARHLRYGGLGLGFNPYDWRVVRTVEPFSVAAEQGIKPGDILIKINKKRVGNWPVDTYGNLNNLGRYRSRDPYFQHILSNRGDSEVELVIQSVGTGLIKKIVKLKVNLAVRTVIGLGNKKRNKKV